MEELYSKMQNLIVDIEKMWIKIIKHFDNDETCCKSMPDWFMKSYNNKINMLKEYETLFFQNEYDKQKKEEYLELLLEKYTGFGRKLYSTRACVYFDRDLMHSDDFVNLLNKINLEIFQIRSFICVLNSNLKLSNDSIDLYLLNDGNRMEFSIFLHNTNTFIGEIRYLKDLDDDGKKLFGDVSYEILEQYRGNGYAGMALDLLAKHLHLNGVNELFIAAYNDNKASIKVIEKFGGIICDTNSYRVCYKCDLANILDKDEISRTQR